MSWLIGSLSKIGERISYEDRLLDPPVDIYARGSVWLAGGGPCATFRKGFTESHKFYIILGHPTRYMDGHCVHLYHSSHSTRLEEDDFYLDLRGRFLIVVTDGKSVKAYGDLTMQRKLYIMEDEREIFFTSSLDLLKRIRKPEIDFSKFGAFWHTMYPLSNQRFAPSELSYYQNVLTMGSGGVAKMGDGVQISNRIFVPGPVTDRIISEIGSITLAPIVDPNRVAVSLSGGMDIRALLAIFPYLKMPVKAFHYGIVDTPDCQVAKQIADSLGFPFYRISHEETCEEDSWQQTLNYMQAGQVFSNPLAAPFVNYCRQVSQEADIMISGYMGEFYRMRYFADPLKTLFRFKPIGLSDIFSFLYRKPPPIFVPDVHQLLYQNFMHELQSAFQALPPQGKMSNPQWMNILFARFMLHTKLHGLINILDGILLDHMPFTEPEVMNYHWHLGIKAQLNESIHRKLIKHFCPALQKFPLVMGNTKAPYSHRQYMLKIREMARLKRAGSVPNPSDLFLQKHRQQILDLLLSASVKT
ncbi:MAG: asparagine synthase-related protein, partial [Candidatus Cloacimonadaceae bacterium]|nr:asparagine synthase-related protein [Candidatus Cloacimonadaceae bacterium]